MKNLIYLFAVVVLASSCNMADNTADMKATAAKERVQQFYDQVINAHNVAMIDSFCSPDFLDHNPDPGHSGKGIEDMKAGFSEFFAEFPDVNFKTNFMMADGDKVMAHVTMTGTNSGAMGDMPATNKQVSIDGIDVVVMKDGKAVERWGFFDSRKMMADLGMMPPPGTPPAAPAEPMKMEEQKK
ncbi:MAG: ester cyclase [Bacteroidia bacterium]|nr:ester cyclase [Bacteroidia bacterium]